MALGSQRCTPSSITPTIIHHRQIPTRRILHKIQVLQVPFFKQDHDFHPGEFGQSVGEGQAETGFDIDVAGQEGGGFKIDPVGVAGLVTEAVFGQFVGVEDGEVAEVGQGRADPAFKRGVGHGLAIDADAREVGQAVPWVDKIRDGCRMVVHETVEVLPGNGGLQEVAEEFREGGGVAVAGCLAQEGGLGGNLRLGGWRRDCG